VRKAQKCEQLRYPPFVPSSGWPGNVKRAAKVRAVGCWGCGRYCSMDVMTKDGLTRMDSLSRVALGRCNRMDELTSRRGSTGRPCVLTTMPMRMPKIGHVVASTGRIHNSRCQVVLWRRWNIDGRGRTNWLDHHISVSNGAEPVFLLARFHRDFDG
jgi:hypothetical protein